MLYSPTRSGEKNRDQPSAGLKLHVGQVGLGWVGFGWVGLDLVGLGWIWLGWIWLGWVGAAPAGRPVAEKSRARG